MRVVRLVIAAVFCLVASLTTGSMDHAKASPFVKAHEGVASHVVHAHGHDRCSDDSCETERPAGAAHSCATMVGHCSYAFVRGDMLQILRREAALRTESGLPDQDIAGGIEPEADTPPPRI